MAAAGPSTLTDATFSVGGMDCASCVSHVEKAAGSVPGVQACRVNLALGRATAGTDEAVPVLVDALKKAPRLESRLAAIRALGEVGPAAKSAENTLYDVATMDLNEEVKELATEAYRKIGGGK